MDTLQQLYSPVTNREVDNDRCFLCGVTLTEENKTEEHVIPKWVQRKFNIWNNRLNLLNQTSIPYRQLTIFCCKPCNSEHLSRLEVAVQKAVNEGPAAVSLLDKNTLALWLSKLFYGLLYKELFLIFDRRQPENGSILSAEQIEKFQALHYFLQSTRVEMPYDFTPYSIFIFECMEPENSEEQWDLIDNYFGLFIAVRLGRTGIICCLQDNACHQELAPEFYEMAKEPLHPTQFRELVAKVAYKNHLIKRVPKYMFAGTDPISVSVSPIGGLSGLPPSDEWDNREYSKILGHYLGMDPKSLIVEDKVLTWLIDEKGEFNSMDLEETT